MTSLQNSCAYLHVVCHKTSTAKYNHVLCAGPQRCRRSALRAARALCRPAPGRGVIQRQHLFTAYTHPPPAFGSAPCLLLSSRLGL